MLDALTQHTVDMTMLQKYKHHLAAMKKQLGATQKSLQGSSTPTMREIEEAAKEFESVFINEMLKPMFSGIDSDPLFGGGQGEEVFKDLMLQEYGKIVAQSSNLGLAEYVKEEMIRIQEEQGGKITEETNAVTSAAISHENAAQHYMNASSTMPIQEAVQ